ncbi:hypothetical protein [uncultured Methylobacterium sp.]|uniref:hypothetical protein n=1 Tax=uncultured Methylobacterium sp. TaxID=157278 RepID=UPI0026218138|nr:hypothetical protein [uncultured Methylobacterium sp.]
MSGDGLIVWRHTWPKGGPDFVAVVAGGTFARIQKDQDNGLREGQWGWNALYPAATGLLKGGRAKTKQEAVEAVRAALDQALRWHAERDTPLLLFPHDDPDPMTAWQRGPLRIVVGQDVPWPEGGR